MSADGEPIRGWPRAAEHMGGAYLRYSFTKGTKQEVEFLIEALRLRPGDRLLDVGCGPGRHAHEAARRGLDVVGVDIAPAFALAASSAAEHQAVGARFAVGDARLLPLRADSFDAAWAICQGGFGSVAGEDALVLQAIATAVRPGGAVAVTAFSAYYQVRWLGHDDAFDPSTGTNTERTTIRDDSGREAPFEMEATCFTPRELRLLAADAGLEVADIWSVEPGCYAAQAPTIELPELLAVLHRPLQ